MLSLLLSLVVLPLQSDQPDLSWLAGSWLDCTGGREASEVWSDPRNGLMVGVNVTSYGEQSGFEYARIQRQPDGRMAYVAQPDGMAPTVFPVLRHDATSVTFANPENDFPHRIVYWRENDRLMARIEGSDEDANRSAEWSFNKVELNTRCPR